MMLNRLHLLWIVPIGLVVFLLFSGWVILQTAPTPKRDLPFSELVTHLKTKPNVGLWLRAKIYRFRGARPPRNGTMPPLTASGVRGLAAVCLSSHGELAVKPLMEALEDSALSVRIDAAWALGELGSIAAKAADTLGNLLADPGLIGSPLKNSNRLVPTSDQDRFRLALAKALGRIAPDHPRTVPVILAWLEKSERPPITQLIDGLTAVDRKPAEATQKLFVRLIIEASPPVGFQLIRKLKDFEKRERRSAGRDIELWSDPVVEAVAGKLDSADPVFREAAAQWMAFRTVPSRDLMEKVSALLLDVHPEVSKAALHCLEEWGTRGGNFGGPELLLLWERLESAPLLEAAPVDEEPSRRVDIAEVSRVAWQLLGKASQPNPKKALLEEQLRLADLAELSRLQQIGIRRQIVRVLGVVADDSKAAVPLLKRLCSEPEAPERWDAAIALWEILREPEHVLRVLREELDTYSSAEHDPDKEILMSRTVDILTEIGVPALPELTRTFDIANNGLRLRTLLAIENLTAAGSPYMEILKKAAKDDYAPIRMRARKVLQPRQSNNQG